MTATSDELTELRDRTNASVSSLSDAFINRVVTKMETRWSGYSRDVILKATEVQLWTDLRARAITEVDYDEGDASEKSSQIFKHFGEMIKLAEKELAELVNDETLPVRWGQMRRDSQWKDKPHG